MSPIDDRIAVIELAEQLQRRKQTVFKVLKRLGIHAVARREPQRRNQFVATLTQEEAAAVQRALGPLSAPGPNSDFVPPRAGDELGVFYVLQLEPAHDPGRFKVGFTA